MNKFINFCANLNFLQLVSKPTRYLTNKPSTLDWVFVNDEHSISELSYHSPIGTSDNVVLTADIRHSFDPLNMQTNYVSYRVVNYDEITNIKWQTLLRPLEDPNEIWNLLHATVTSLSTKHSYVGQ
ncbi:hypothetical protein WA026_020965 [Henosepilachna vigintioctopunctata]|uniref:Uncharacterized protein n=1 Tax=Henosepilachna vigintioctopunctata TaxID=420089 RepID=A0AAW1VBL4_9CUCU